MSGRFVLHALAGPIAVLRLPLGTGIPQWTDSAGFLATVRTHDSLSIVCDAAVVPDDVSAKRDWRLLRLDGEFDFDQSGILAAIAAPLGARQIPTLVVSAYETDYFLVQEKDFEDTIAALRTAGHAVDLAEA